MVMMVLLVWQPTGWITSNGSNKTHRHKNAKIQTQKLNVQKIRYITS